MTISTYYSPRLLDATSRLRSFQFLIPIFLATMTTHKPWWTLLPSFSSYTLPLSPTLVNTSASALEAREKFRRSLVCRAVAEARHGSSRIRWKFHPVRRRFKSQNCKFSNRISGTFVVIPFFRDSNAQCLVTNFACSFVRYRGNSFDFEVFKV